MQFSTSTALAVVAFCAQQATAVYSGVVWPVNEPAEATPLGPAQFAGKADPATGHFDIQPRMGYLNARSLNCVKDGEGVISCGNGVSVSPTPTGFHCESGTLPIRFSFHCFGGKAAELVAYLAEPHAAGDVPYNCDTKVEVWVGQAS
ncbi:hypothetical protein E4U42_004520 [Claviceps africana]|uniref:Uncharacterized protein n=1 Tax=Claviceps africana TaxID=83212 RepID=A0A8K0NLN0_9HYPO|nr:hypothetical protein E4U42_004520 [Claviceps africana]